ncbi:hypothetical protein LEP1GSC103_0308 [Leptospira borgpetersenii serovar Javanica str. UI 09931]|uniref:Uncharacterized protein n=1 Tax=Leptospira borgpetersenii serovar Javanica str. UI 09931 TaxID=1049767 RepID=A0AAV3JIC4_LEPBO|nr:hypothetical protein LEP1GSC101_2710 [Leptospira borgpetersenii str. UI 09149]EMK10540.1 hypothetical protein LEP1GSC066_0419 [Leptospira sp. serovar Kenya str. Sh9]EMN58085.1 hypothetical protein LEP1GSC090_3833 [Leptospira borgpetersenii serovar Javanica str. MK146]EPG58979.1 hypothetical protein LEP1GSC103_0308 [Leptospira borgpetersenii serovar Javanica str. UI 09931]
MNSDDPHWIDSFQDFGKVFKKEPALRILRTRKRSTKWVANV